MWERKKKDKKEESKGKGSKERQIPSCSNLNLVA
jgi:hypothetical protein